MTVKCAKCGFVDIYWRGDRHDPDLQVANSSDVKIPEAFLDDKFAYRVRGRQGQFTVRIPIEIYNARLMALKDGWKFNIEKRTKPESLGRMLRENKIFKRHIGQRRLDVPILTNRNSTEL